MRYILLAMLLLSLAQPLSAQSRTTEFLRRMDANRNGRLEPNEISDRARPYLERFAREAGIRLSGSVSISQLEAAARRSSERRDRDSSNRGSSDRGSSDRGSSDRGSSDRGVSSFSGAARVMSVPGFGPDEDTHLIPGFGPDASIRYPYIAADEERVNGLFSRYDRNKDGTIDGEEAQRVPWRDGNPFVYDFNGDGLISRVEMAQRYARVRIAEENDERAKSNSSRSGSRDDERSRDDRRSRESDDRRGGDPGNRDGARRTNTPDRRTYELAYSIMSRHDRNRNSMLDRPEWPALGDNASQADEDRNGEITRNELAVWLSRDIQKRYKDFSGEMPGWFFELDANEDHQISMSEFSQEWNAEKLEEFADFDRNDDGLITEKELLGSKSAVGGNYKNEKASVIMPAGVLVSDIQIDDDYLIGDLNIKLSISHTNAEQINAYLIGPDEQRIELFTGVGRSDDHFDGTVLDDEAGERITRARPPFRGSFKPESAEKDGPSLSHFYGKSIHGLWRLEIRTSRGDRPGMLHGWALLVERPDELDSDVLRDEAASAGDEESAPATDSQEADRGGRGSYRGDRRSFGGGPPSFGGGTPGFGGGRPPMRGRPGSGGGDPSSSGGRSFRGRGER